jgi:hypothetical protein
VVLYGRLFKHKGVSLPKHIYLLTALLPGMNVYFPYSEILEINDHLIVSDQNYAFFKEAGTKNNNQTKDG